MKCTICNSHTDRWPDSICDKCLGAVRRDLASDKDDPTLDVFIPFEEAFENDE